MYNINITNLKKIIQIDKPILVSVLIKKYISKISNLCIAVLINNDIKDKNYLIDKSLNLKLILINEKNGLHIIKQSCAFLCAYAIKKLWPSKEEINISINENGFLYDFDLNYRISKNDLSIIEHYMFFLLKTAFKIKHSFFNKKTIKNILIKNGEKNILHNLKFLQYRPLIKIFYIENYVTFNPFFFTDHIKYFSYFNLHNISGIYLNNTSKMIQRIQSIVFNNKIELKKFFILYEKIKKIDHRKISKILDLYHIEKDSPGLVFWHENGVIIFNILKTFIQNKLKYFKYKESQTPLILNDYLWYKTGHLTYYKDYIFTIKNKSQNLCVKPMNCPAHVQIYKQKIKSYKDLPYKISEFGNCFRNESSGSLHGLMRLRSFTQDDAHIFCTFNQLKKEINQFIKLVNNIYYTFGFKYILVKLSTRPINRYGTEEEWDKAELMLANILIQNYINFNYQLNSGAFYGPKIEFILNDSFNRQWQCGTLQIDFSLAQRLNIFYIDKNNNRKHPIIIHRAILGSLERFIGILLEEYEGILPLWLSPIQVIVINITIKEKKYAIYINNILLRSNIRSILDLRKENISYKIRDNMQKKIPYIIICGKKEMKTKTISFRFKIYNANYIPINHFIYYFFNKSNTQ